MQNFRRNKNARSQVSTSSVFAALGASVWLLICAGCDTPTPVAPKATPKQEVPPPATDIHDVLSSKITLFDIKRPQLWGANTQSTHEILAQLNTKPIAALSWMDDDVNLLAGELYHSGPITVAPTTGEGAQHAYIMWLFSAINEQAPLAVARTFGRGDIKELLKISGPGAWGRGRGDFTWTRDSTTEALLIPGKWEFRAQDAHPALPVLKYLLGTSNLIILESSDARMRLPQSVSALVIAEDVHRQRWKEFAERGCYTKDDRILLLSLRKAAEMVEPIGDIEWPSYDARAALIERIEGALSHLYALEELRGVLDSDCTQIDAARSEKKKPKRAPENDAYDELVADPE